MRAGAPDPHFFQESILKEEKHLDSCLARRAAGEDFRKTERLNPKELRGLVRTSTAPQPFRSTLTANDRTLLKEFTRRPRAAKHEPILPYATIADKHEGFSEYRRTFGGGCPWASTSPDFGATLSRYAGRPNTSAASFMPAQVPTFPQRPSTSLPPTPKSRDPEHAAAAERRQRSTPWAAAFGHLPKESSAKGSYTMQDTVWPAHLKRLAQPAVVDVEDRMFSVPYIDLMAADCRSSTIVRPHGSGALVDGPLKTTSSFRKGSQTIHF
eukprot:gb/GFBE01081696.1/.p1 GENE.gb/GFBE01081696.1/~~gb/GFBE01081696.1/.p1  ORF type:complete len:268 (+),score=28.58 gb/GFBE01081696.1/:1-804(+)